MFKQSVLTLIEKIIDPKKKAEFKKQIDALTNKTPEQVNQEKVSDLKRLASKLVDGEAKTALLSKIDELVAKASNPDQNATFDADLVSVTKEVEKSFVSQYSSDQPAVEAKKDVLRRQIQNSDLPTTIKDKLLKDVSNSTSLSSLDNVETSLSQNNIALKIIQDTILSDLDNTEKLVAKIANNSELTAKVAEVKELVKTNPELAKTKLAELQQSADEKFKETVTGDQNAKDAALVAAKKEILKDKVSNSNLSEDQKDALNTQIDSATDAATLANLSTQVQDSITTNNQPALIVSEKTTHLNDLVEKILDPELKQQIKNQIAQASQTTNANDGLTSLNDIQNQIQSEINKQSTNPDTTLINAKKAALIDQITASNLSETEKTQLISNINAPSTLADLATQQSALATKLAEQDAKDAQLSTDLNDLKELTAIVTTENTKADLTAKVTELIELAKTNPELAKSKMQEVQTQIEQAIKDQTVDPNNKESAVLTAKKEVEKAKIAKSSLPATEKERLTQSIEQATDTNALTTASADVDSKIIEATKATRDANSQAQLINNLLAQVSNPDKRAELQKQLETASKQVSTDLPAATNSLDELQRDVERTISQQNPSSQSQTNPVVTAKKDSLLNQINASNLPESEKATLRQAVLNATDNNAVNTQETNVTTQLNNQLNKTNNVLSDVADVTALADKITNNEQKTSLKARLDEIKELAKTNPEEAKTQLATVQADVETKFKEQTGGTTDAQNTALLNAQKEIEKAKITASNLSQEEKTRLTQAVETANSSTDLATQSDAVNQAINTSQAGQNSATAKHTLIEDLLKDVVDPVKKAELKEKLDAANAKISTNTTEATTALNNLQSEIETVLNNQENSTPTSNTSTLIEAKKAVLRDKINESTLLDEEKAKLIEQINNAQTTEQVTEATTATTKALDDELVRAQSDAIANKISEIQNSVDSEIVNQAGLGGLVKLKKSILEDKINESNLPEAKKQELLAAITAPDSEDKAEILTALRGVEATVAKELELQAKKDEALAIANKLSDGEEKTALLNQINSGTIQDTEAAQNAINQAQQAAQAKITESTTAVQAAIAQVAGDSAKVQELSEKLARATTQDEIKAIQEQAVTELNNAQTNVQNYLAQLDDSNAQKQALQAELDKIVAQGQTPTVGQLNQLAEKVANEVNKQNNIKTGEQLLDAASNLTTEEKNQLRSEIQGATTADAAAIIKDKIAEKKEFSDSKKEATDSVSGVTNAAKKAEFEAALANATTKEKAAEIRSQAAAYAAQETANTEHKARLDALLDNITDPQERQRLQEAIANAMLSNGQPNPDQATVTAALNAAETQLNAKLLEEQEQANIKNEKVAQAETELAKVTDSTKKAELQQRLDAIKANNNLIESNQQLDVLIRDIETQKTFETDKRLAQTEISHLRLKDSTKKAELQRRLNEATTSEQANAIKAEALTEKTREDQEISNKRKEVRDAIKKLSDGQTKDRLNSELETALPNDDLSSENDIADIAEANRIKAEAESIITTLGATVDASITLLDGLTDTDVTDGYTLNKFNEEKAKADNQTQTALNDLNERAQAKLQSFRDKALAEVAKLDYTNPKKAELITAINLPTNNVTKLKELQAQAHEVDEVEEGKKEVTRLISELESAEKAQQFRTELDQATTKAKVDEVKVKVQQAKAQQDQDKQTTYQAALALINSIEDATEKDNLLKQINGVDDQGQANTTGPATNLTLTDLEQIKSVAQAQKDKETRELDKVKQQALDLIGQVNDQIRGQDATEENKFTKKINDATTKAAVQTLIQQMQAQRAKAKEDAQAMLAKLNENNQARALIQGKIDQFQAPQEPTEAEWDKFIEEVKAEITRIRTEAKAVVNRLKDGDLKTELTNSLTNEEENDTETEILALQARAQAVLDAAKVKAQAALDKITLLTEHSALETRINNTQATETEYETIEQEAQRALETAKNNLTAEVDKLLAFVKPEDQTTVQAIKDATTTADNSVDLQTQKQALDANVKELVNKELNRLLAVADTSKNHPELVNLIAKLNDDAQTDTIDKKLALAQEAKGLLTAVRTQAQTALEKLEGDDAVKSEAGVLPAETDQTYADLLSIKEKAEELFDREKQNVTNIINTLTNKGTLEAELANSTNLSGVKAVLDKAEKAKLKQDITDIINQIENQDRKEAVRAKLTDAGDDKAKLEEALIFAQEKLGEDQGAIETNRFKLLNKLQSLLNQPYAVPQTIIDKLSSKSDENDTQAELDAIEQEAASYINSKSSILLNNLEQNNPQKAGFESNNPTRVDDAIVRYNDIDKANFKEDAQDQINLLPSTLPQGDTGQTLQQIFNTRLAEQDSKEHFASVRSEVLALLGEHTKATSAINDLPHQGNRSALANELLKADTVQKVTEILAKVTPLREKIQQAQDKLSGTSENPGVSQQNATGLRDELNAADTLEKAQAVLEKIEAALAKDEQDRQYAQSQTNGTNALNELPEGSRALFQEQLNNARTKEATEAVIVKIREFKQEQDTTRQNIVSNITSENNRAKLLEDLNNVQSIDGFEAIKQRERDLTAKIAEVKEQIELILVSDRNDYWNVKLQEHFNENVSTIKNNLTNVLNEARELDGNDDTTRLSQFENTKQLAIEKANVAKEILTTMNDNTGALLLSELNNASDSTQIQTVKSKIAPLKQAIFDFWRPYKDSFSIIIDASRNKNEPSIFVDGQKYKNINDAIVDMLYSTTDATQFRNSSFALRNMYVQNHKYWQEAKTITSTTAKNTFNQRMVALTKVNQFAPLIQEVQQYKTKETELTTKINQFTSESKKAHFNSLLNNATNKARVEEIIALIDTIETKKTETTQANNTLEDQDLKAQFSTRINDATSVEQLQQIANEIETAKQNYQTKRQETTNLKDSLTNVNQKNHYNTRITSARSTTELNQIITEINQLKNKNTDNQRLVDEFNKYFVHLTEKKQQIQNKLNEVSNLEQANAFENAYNDIRYDKNNSITKWAATVGRRISDYNHPDAFVYIIGFQHNRGVQNKNIYFVLEDTQNRNNIITISDPKTEFVPHSQIEINDIFTNNSHTTTSNAQTQNSNIANSKLEYNKIYELKLIYSPDGQYRTTTPSFNSIINTSK